MLFLTWSFASLPRRELGAGWRKERKRKRKSFAIHIPFQTAFHLQSTLSFFNHPLTCDSFLHVLSFSILQFQDTTEKHIRQKKIHIWKKAILYSSTRCPHCKTVKFPTILLETNTLTQKDIQLELLCCQMPTFLPSLWKCGTLPQEKALAKESWAIQHHHPKREWP